MNINSIYDFALINLNSTSNESNIIKHQQRRLKHSKNKNISIKILYGGENIISKLELLITRKDGSEDNLKSTINITESTLVRDLIKKINELLINEYNRGGTTHNFNIKSIKFNSVSIEMLETRKLLDIIKVLKEEKSLLLEVLEKPKEELEEELKEELEEELSSELGSELEELDLSLEYKNFYNYTIHDMMGGDDKKTKYNIVKILSQKLETNFYYEIIISLIIKKNMDINLIEPQNANPREPKLYHYEQLIKILEELYREKLTETEKEYLRVLLMTPYKFNDPITRAFNYVDNIYGTKGWSESNIFNIIMDETYIQDIEFNPNKIYEYCDQGYILRCGSIGHDYNMNIVYYKDGYNKMCMMVNQNFYPKISEHMFIHRLPSSLLYSKITGIRFESNVLKLHKYAIKIYKPKFIVSSPVNYMISFFSKLVDYKIIEEIINPTEKQLLNDKLNRNRLCFNSISAQNYTKLYKVLTTNL